MDVLLQFLVVLAFIFIGARLGGIGIGYAGAAGVIVLGLMGLPVDPMEGIPWSVLGIILAVIACIGAMEAAGGLDYLVSVTERILRRNPKRITFYAPIVTYLMTVFCGTGTVAFSSLPVIAEVAKETGVRPSRPMSIAAVASQVAITASPISAAMVAMSSIAEEYGVSYLQVLMITIPTTFVGVLVGALVASRMGVELEDDPVYQERQAKGLVTHRDVTATEVKPYAKRSVAIFGVILVLVIAYATLISESVGLIAEPPLGRDAAIMSLMMTAGLLICLLCKVPVNLITGQSTYKAGTSAALCILGVAWLGNTFVAAHTDAIEAVGGDIMGQYPWLLAVVLFFASALLYSQGATTVTLMPVAQALGLPIGTMIASFPAVSGLFVLPTYPTTVAAIEMDDTGSTRIGKFVFNHPFLLPGVVVITVAVALGFLLTSLVL